MRKKFKVKVVVTGPDDDGVVRVLNRTVKQATEGVLYESDHRHADRVTQELEMKKGQSVATPSVRGSRKLAPRKAERTWEGLGARIAASMPDPMLVPRKAERTWEGYGARRAARSTGRAARATTWATRRTPRRPRPVQAGGPGGGGASERAREKGDGGEEMIGEAATRYRAMVARCN